MVICNFHVSDFLICEYFHNGFILPIIISWRGRKSNYFVWKISVVMVFVYIWFLSFAFFLHKMRNRFIMYLLFIIYFRESSNVLFAVVCETKCGIYSQKFPARCHFRRWSSCSTQTDKESFLPILILLLFFILNDDSIRIQ